VENDANSPGRGRNRDRRQGMNEKPTVARGNNVGFFRFA